MKKILYLSIILVFLILGAGIFYYWIVLPSKLVLDASEKIAEGVADAFNFSPKISIKNSVVFEENAAILEVALFSQRIIYDYEYNNTWMGSTKELHLRGVYLAKYGFNLKKQNFSININEDNSNFDSVYNLIFVIPEPVLLSFETDNYRIIRDRDGWWNKIDENERETAVNSVREAARKKALSLDYRNKVKDSIESQLKMMIEELPLDIQIGQINIIWQDKSLDEMHLQDDTLKISLIEEG